MYKALASAPGKHIQSICEKRKISSGEAACRKICSRDQATLYEGVSIGRMVGPSVRPSEGCSVTSYCFSLLGVTSAVRIRMAEWPTLYFK